MNFTTYSMFRQIRGTCSKAGKFALSSRQCGKFRCVLSQGISTDAKSTFELKAGPWGKIRIRAANLDSIVIVPLNAHMYPTQDKVLINCMKGKQLLGKVDIEDRIVTSVEDNNVNLDDAKCEGVEHLSCHIQLPLKMDIEANLGGSTSIGIEKMESEDLDISLQNGKCLLKSIQGKDVRIDSNGGDIVMKSFIQGNIQIRGKNETNIEGERIQGLSLDIGAESGKIYVKDIYADKSRFTLGSGQIHLGNCHRKAEVRVTQQGQLTVDSVDGNIKAHLEKGDVNMYAVKHENIDITTKNGNIDVKVLDSIRTKVDLRANAIELDDQLHIEGSTTKDENNNLTSVAGSMEAMSGDNDGNDSSDRIITAHTGSGKIIVKCQDWLSSLNLMSK